MDFNPGIASIAPLKADTLSSQEASRRQQRTAAWFADLRDRICAAFETVEDDYAGTAFGDASVYLERRLLHEEAAEPGQAPVRAQQMRRAAGPRKKKPVQVYTYAGRAAI